MEVTFTHLWVKGFGWETTVYHLEDFEEVKEFVETDTVEKYFIGIFDNGSEVFMKGKFLN